MNLHEAQHLAINLIRHFGLAEKGWKFKFDSARKRFGLCSYREQIISLSRVLVELNDRVHVEDTIRHEIAHALVGPRAGHNRRWKLQAIKCGAKPERCYSAKTVVGVQNKYEGQCIDCGERIGYMRRPSKRMIRSGYHLPCRRRKNRGKLLWSRRHPAPSTPAQPPAPPPVTRLPLIHQPAAASQPTQFKLFT